MMDTKLQDSNRAYLMDRFVKESVPKDVRDLQELFIPLYEEICAGDFLLIVNEHNPSYIGHVGSTLLAPSMHGQNANPHISVVFDYEESRIYGGKYDGDTTHDGSIYPGAMLYIGKTSLYCHKNWSELKK